MLSRMLGFGALLAGEVAAVVGLHLLGGLPWFALPAGDVSGWLTTSAPEDVVVALLRLVALGGAYWLALSTVAYALARASQVPAAVRGAGWVTLPVVRRVADRAVAVTVATSLVGGAAPAAFAGVGGAAPTEVPGAPPVEAVERGPEGRVPSGEIPPPLLTPETLPDPAPAETAPRPGGGENAPEGAGDVSGEETGHAPKPPRAGASDEHDRYGGEDAGDVHVVEPGDHLWSIAATHLAEGSPGDAAQLDPEEIAARWREVVADNRARLRSGDPDLIFPGERIELPPEEE